MYLFNGNTVTDGFWLIQGQWVSMGVNSDGSYGIEAGLIYSLPVEINPDHTFKIVQGLDINDFARNKLDTTKNELIEEKNSALEACTD